MQKQILAELKELRIVVSKLVGSSDDPVLELFSMDKVEKAAKDFKKLFINRGEWVQESDLHKYFKGVHYGAGAFIRREFGFSNYFKKGKAYFYNRTDLLSLAKALKERNVNLCDYIELKTDQDNFRKRVSSATLNKKASRIPYLLPGDLRDIIATDPPRPSIELIKTDLKNLEVEFFDYKLAEYIDIFRGNYAMVKSEYYFTKYYPNEVKNRCKRWCERFNYANHALELLGNEGARFVPLKEEDMIQL